MIGLQEQKYMRNLFYKLKKELHLTDKQVYKKFPCLINLLREEEIQNIRISTSKLFREVKYEIRKEERLENEKT